MSARTMMAAAGTVGTVMAFAVVAAAVMSGAVMVLSVIAGMADISHTVMCMASGFGTVRGAARIMIGMAVIAGMAGVGCAVVSMFRSNVAAGNVADMGCRCRCCRKSCRCAGSHNHSRRE